LIFRVFLSSKTKVLSFFFSFQSSVIFGLVLLVVLVVLVVSVVSVPVVVTIIEVVLVVLVALVMLVVLVVLLVLLVLVVLSSCCHAVGVGVGLGGVGHVGGFSV
jgi:hypothetical protein